MEMREEWRSDGFEAGMRLRLSADGESGEMGVDRVGGIEKHAT